MARIFITGSSDGLGRMAARLLVADGHRVVLHARSDRRAEEAKAAVPEAEGVIIGDFTSLAQVRGVAEAANEMGAFDAVIHNAAVGYKEKRRDLTEDGLPVVFQVNTLAPYMLTGLSTRPKRLVYISSELHRRVSPGLDDLLWERRAWNGNKAYSETKLHCTVLAFAAARRWPGVLASSVEPGWVATKMSGPRASGDLAAGPRTQAWLAVSEDAQAQVSGEDSYHMAPLPPNPLARQVEVQERLLELCAGYAGLTLPVA